MSAKNVVLASLLAMAILPVKAGPVVVPPNQPFEADVPVVVIPLEEFKGFIEYVRTLGKQAEKCKGWKSTKETSEVDQLAFRKED